MQFPFFKYQGTGNDFVMIDDRSGFLASSLNQDIVSKICARRMGVGADGLILLSPADTADFRMIYYNSDGRESSMCGNGGRCLVAFAHDLGLIDSQCRFEAVDGMHEAYYEQEGTVRLRMSPPTGYREIGAQQKWIDTGSPHYVDFTDTDLGTLDVFTEGRSIRNSPEFQAEGTNVNFVNILKTGTLRVRTYERGVEDETLSCGTGVTACAYLYLQDLAPTLTTVHVETEGGSLQVEVINRGTATEEVWLSGPTQQVFSATYFLTL